MSDRGDVQGKTIKGETVEFKAKVNSVYWWRKGNRLVIESKLEVATLPPVLPADLDVIEKPSFDLRGMYAHQHWAYNHPYALRTWTIDQWKQYVDMLAVMRVNLFQIWSMDAAGNDVYVVDKALRRIAKFSMRYRKTVSEK